MNASKRRWLPVAVAAAVIFYFGLYFWGAHSEGFRYLDSVIRSSPAIQQRVGDVRSVRLSFFGGYREKFVDSDIRTTMVLDVTGSKGAVAVHASASRTSGQWSVYDASIDGHTVKLN